MKPLLSDKDAATRDMALEISSVPQLFNGKTQRVLVDGALKDEVMQRASETFRKNAPTPLIAKLENAGSCHFGPVEIGTGIGPGKDQKAYLWFDVWASGGPTKRTSLGGGNYIDREPAPERVLSFVTQEFISRLKYVEKEGWEWELA